MDEASQEVFLDLRITDGERTRYTEIYGTDPLARDGWLVRRIRHELEVLGYGLTEPFDLLSASDGETIQAPGVRGKRPVVVEIQNDRKEDARTFRVRIP